MVGWAKFSEAPAHNTHTRKSKGKETLKDDESKRWEKYNCRVEDERKMGYETRCFWDYLSDNGEADRPL